MVRFGVYGLTNEDVLLVEFDGSVSRVVHTSNGIDSVTRISIGLASGPGSKTSDR